MRTIVAGSRGVTDYADVCEAIEACPWRDQITHVVSGGAQGVDRLGERWAKEHSIPINQFIPAWETNGRAAGVLRNEDMAQNAEALIAVWDGKSKGTADMIGRARRHNLKVYIHYIDH